MLEKYLKKGMRLALAVSGGKDSMVMLDKILRLKERFNLDVRVVNVNHKIRMNGGEDSRFVADYCKKRGVKCEVYEVDVPEYAAKKKLSLGNRRSAKCVTPCSTLRQKIPITSVLPTT